MDSYTVIVAFRVKATDLDSARYKAKYMSSVQNSKRNDGCSVLYVKETPAEKEQFQIINNNKNDESTTTANF